MESDNSFEKLKVWQLSHRLVLEILTRKFPSEEKFSLTDQIRRSASSVPTNIAEGNERKTKKEFIQFLYTSKGSLAETKYHLLLARDLGYMTNEEYLSLQRNAIEISKMISALITYLNKSES